MYVGIDIGGTNIRITATTDIQSRELADTISIPNSPDYDENIRKIEEAIGSLGVEITSIGVSTPGNFNDDDTVMIRSTNMPQWVGKPSINSSLTSRFNCEVLKANDTVCGALGEAKSREGTDPFFFISYGTGLSGAWVTYENSAPTATKIDEDTQLTIFASWQADCSGKNIQREFKKSGEELSDEEWKIVTDRFQEHLHEFMEKFKPPEVVLGGGMSIKQAERLKRMIVEFQQKYPEYQNHKFTFAKLGEKAALFGALALLN